MEVNSTFGSTLGTSMGDILVEGMSILEISI